MKTYRVTGMTCAACSARVEKAVRKVDGVTDCAVNLLTGTMNVEGTASETVVSEAVIRAGYGIAGSQTKQTADVKKEKGETTRIFVRLTISVLLLLPLLYLSMGVTMGNWPVPDVFRSHASIGLCQLLLAAAIMTINGTFFVSGGKALFRLSPNMDTLVAMGSLAAFVYSTCVLFETLWLSTEKAYYFESAGMILTLITVGKLLESHAKGRTTDALKSLIALQPDTATLLVDGEERVAPVSRIQTSDLFVLRPGDRIPADGVVMEGTSTVDESAMTGESIPVDKGIGDSVSAATVNRSGFLICRSTKVGEDTAFAQIIRTVSDASATKAPIARVADKVAAVFVPTVMAIAAITVAVWLITGADIGYALSRGVSVLVISCPCALGLATPVAIMVASGVGAKQGILYKTAAALETAGRIRKVALDKTGTVTNGTPRVTDVLPVNGTSEETLLALAYAVEKKSEHPLAHAVCEYVKEMNFTEKNAVHFTVLPGSGVRAEVDGVAVYGGSGDFARDYAVLSEIEEHKTRLLSEQGKTPLYFWTEKGLLGVIAVADTAKSDSKQAVDVFRRMGIETVILTGDNEVTAKAVAAQVGIDRVIAGVKPEEKAKTVEELAKQGKTAMVGDGINDAPALTTADLGVAIGAGADVAVDAADVVLINSRLTDSVTAVALGRACLRTIRQNLFWAFFYNCLGIPLAAGAFVPLFGWELNPMIAAGAMSLSSFCVVCNALRLNFFRFNRESKTDKTVPTGQIRCSCEGDTPVNSNNQQIERMFSMEKQIKVTGMMCPRCEAHVKEALLKVDGVTAATADHTEGVATVTLSKDVSDDLLKQAVIAAGYDAE